MKPYAGKWFCGFGLAEKAPDFTTVCKFRNLIGTKQMLIIKRNNMKDKTHFILQYLERGYFCRFLKNIFEALSIQLHNKLHTGHL